VAPWGRRYLRRVIFTGFVLQSFCVILQPRALPETRITFWRLVWPEAMVTEQRGTFKRFAKNSMQASLARPSKGGEVKETLSALPSSPVMAFFLARGWTLIANLTPLADS